MNIEKYAGYGILIMLILLLHVSSACYGVFLSCYSQTVNGPDTLECMDGTVRAIIKGEHYVFRRD